MQFTFEKLKSQDLGLIYKWLNEDHVAEVWKRPSTFSEVEEKYGKKIASDKVSPHLVYLEGTPIGYIQSYHASCKDENLWHAEPEGTWGIGQYIGDKDYLGQGCGTQFVKEFTDNILKTEHIERLMTDPCPSNTRAIKSYVNAGFNPLRTIQTPGGKVLLMDKKKPPMITTERTLCRLAGSADMESILQFHQENDLHFSKWDPEHPTNFYSEAFWKERIESARNEFASDKSMRLVVYNQQRTQIIATINFTNFERGPFQNCRIGYKIGKKYEGQGLMQESLSAAIDYAFHFLQFHRIEANYIPDNVRSRKLLKRLNFTEVGISKNYLKIANLWQDHILTHLNNPFWENLSQ